jgi:hypothetical protein
MQPETKKHKTTQASFLHIIVPLQSWFAGCSKRFRGKAREKSILRLSLRTG